MFRSANAHPQILTSGKSAKANANSFNSANFYTDSTSQYCQLLVCKLPTLPWTASGPPARGSWMPVAARAVGVTRLLHGPLQVISYTEIKQKRVLFHNFGPSLTFNRHKSCIRILIYRNNVQLLQEGDPNNSL
jgi:hypothetical protein